MITRESVIKNRDENKRVLSEIDNAHNEIITRKLDEVEQRHARIMAKIKSLQDEKGELLSGEVTNQELIENAKNGLRERRDEFINSIVSKHLESCKLHNAKPFDSKINIPDWRIWEIVFMGLTGKDIEKAVNLLPDTGTTAKERLSGVAAIDEEILSLTKIMDDELNTIKSQN